MMSLGMQCRSELRGGFVLAVALAIIATMCAGALFHQVKAYADQGLETGLRAGGMPAAQRLELGTQADSMPFEETLGWLGRRGDFWYSTDPSSSFYEKPVLCMVDGLAYDCRSQLFDDEGKPATMDKGPWMVYYREDGEIVYQGGNYLDLQKVAASDEATFCGGRFCTSVDHASYKYLPLHIDPWNMEVRPWYAHFAMLEAIEDYANATWKVFHLRKITITKDLAYYDNPYYIDPEGAGISAPDSKILETGYWEGFFANRKELVEVDFSGLAYFRPEALDRLAYLFQNCTGLRELDLSAMNTTEADDLKGMFDGCYSLVSLKLGENWSQRRTQINEEGDHYARFPIDMADGQGAVYHAGDVIPDGAATYTAVGHSDISTASVRLLPPSSDGAYGALQETGELVCEYNGRQIRPTIEVEFDGVALEEGSDFRAEYKNNVEDGVASVKIVGMGDYFGACDASFEIVDTGAYAFLYENGLMVLKAGHGMPSNRLVSQAVGLSSQIRCFDAQTPDPGKEVGWAPHAPTISRVIIDESFGQFKPVSLGKWFAGCSSLSRIDGLENIDASAAVSATGLFSGCERLPSVQLQELGTSHIADLSELFAGCTSLEYVTFADDAFASAVDLRGFFRDCSSLSASKLPAGALSRATDVSEFFAGCTSLASIDMAGFDMQCAIDLSRMFAGCTALKSVDLSGVDASRALDASGMFEGCAKLADLELAGVNMSSVRDFGCFLRGCSSLAVLDLSGFVAPQAASFDGFLEGCNALATIDLGDVDVSAVADMSGFLAACPNVQTVKTGAGWRNVGLDGGLPVVFPREAFRVSPSFARYAAGTAVPDGAAEYRFGDIAMQFCTVSMDAPTYACTGKLVEPKPEVMLGTTKLTEGVDYSLSYANNLYPGKASVTVLGKGAFSGGLIVPFTIEARITEVGDRLIYKTPTATYTLKVTGVTKKGGQVTSMAVAIVDINVKSGKVKTLSLPTQCTVGDVSATVTAVGSKLTGVFRNVKTVIIGPNVVIIGARAFAGAPKVKKLIIQSARLSNVKNCLKGSKVKTVATQVWLTKKQRKTYKKWFTKKSGKKGVKFIYQ